MTLGSFLPAADYLYVAIFVALGGFAAYEHHHLIAEGEMKEVVAVQKASAKAMAAADAENARVSLLYEAKLRANENAYQATLASANDRAAELARSLSAYTNHRCPSPVLPRPATAGEPSIATAVAGRDGEIADAAAALFQAAAADAAQLNALIAERESLTGK